MMHFLKGIVSNQVIASELVIVLQTSALVTNLTTLQLLDLIDLSSNLWFHQIKSLNFGLLITDLNKRRLTAGLVPSRYARVVILGFDI